MRLVQYYIYNTKTLEKIANFGVNREKAVKALSEMDNLGCYALGMKWFNL